MKHIIATIVTLATSAIMISSAMAQNIGVSMSNFDDNWLTKLRMAIEADAKKQGIKIQFEDAQKDVGRQLSQVQNFIVQKVDAMIIDAVTTAATPQMTKLATEAGIPLVYVNRRPFESFEGKLPKGATFVGSDDDVPGKLQAEALVRILNGKGNIAILMGELGSGPAEQRTGGAEKVIAQHPDMKVIAKETANWQRVAAMDVMNNWLISGEKIDGVIANSGEMAIGAVMALQAAGRDPKKTPVAATDGTEDGLTLVGKGDLAVDVFQDAKGQGKLALDLAVKMAKDEQVESINWVPYELVTKENYKEFSDR